MRKCGMLAGMLLILVQQPARAEPLAVDLELVLAADTSYSMDADERRLQIDGYASAFRDRNVASAILSGRLRRIAVIYIEWSTDQKVVVPWTLLQNQTDITKFADAIAQTPAHRSYGGTNLTGAIAFAALSIRSNEFVSARLAIDISGDGANNTTFPPDPVRDQTVEQGITINGLPLNRLRGDPHDPNAQPTDVYYHDHVIGGPGAFLVVANGAHDFVRAIRQKLLREIAAR